MITLIIDGTEHEVKQFTFNDGSVQVEIQDMPQEATEVVFDVRLQSPADQMALIMTMQAMREALISFRSVLAMAFTPYGRQDAAFVEGQANAIKAWAHVINSLNFDAVCVMDPHSIAVSHIDRLHIVDVVEVLEDSGIMRAFGDAVLVSPDAGANKKCHKIAKHFGFTEMVRADKARNLATGEILETIVYGDVAGKHCLIVDDICDGGMTFIKLGEKLKEMGAERVTLFVTHGLFTKGLKVFEGIIDNVYTTESWTRADGITEGYTGNFIVV